MFHFFFLHQKSPSDEEDTLSDKSSDTGIRSSSLSKPSSSKGTGAANVESSGEPSADSSTQYRDNAASDPDPSPNPPLISRLPRDLCSKITKLEIPMRRGLDPEHPSPREEGYETAEESFLREEDFMVPKLNLFEDEDEGEEDEKPMIPKEKIMQRIDSHKGMKSYQLAQHLSTRWSTGAGPRIGCMRDYPSELQFRVLEQANLSPRSKGTFSSPRNPSRFNQKVLMTQNSLGLDTN